MNQSAVNAFRALVSQKLKHYTPQPNDLSTLDAKLNAAQAFYTHCQSDLCHLIEDAQAAHQINTNTILLLHLVDREVNGYFDIERDYPDNWIY